MAMEVRCSPDNREVIIGDTLIGTLRKTYGAQFAAGCATTTSSATFWTNWTNRLSADSLLINRPGSWSGFVRMLERGRQLRRPADAFLSNAIRLKGYFQRPSFRCGRPHAHFRQHPCSLPG